MSDFTDRVVEVARDVFERKEFRHYLGHRDEVVDRVVAGYGAELEDRTAVARDEWIEARIVRDTWARGTGRRTMRAAEVLLMVAALGFVVGIAITLIPTATLASWLSVDPDGSWIARRHFELVATLVMGGLVASIVGGVLLAQRRLVHRAVELPVVAAQGRYDRALDTAVQEAIAAAVNDLLGPQGIVAFPTHAPRLVELDTSQVTPSGTTEYVREFIVEHESSAIGLAGPRGSGKSTVMRALRADPDVGLVTIVPSPVRYEAGEFVRVLLGQIASVIAGPRTRRDPASRLRARIRSASWFSLAVPFGLGALLIAINVGLFGWPWAMGEPSSVLGLLLVAATMAVVAGKVTPGHAGEGLPPEVRRARELLRDLRWETERSTTAKGLVKAWSVAEAGAERAFTMRHRGYTRAELVAELRALLTLFAGSADRGRLVVCVDELDKVDTVEHLVEIVNELKDLFHVQRVHFVVAVSTDALESFEKRGLSARDAFDSAFDTIVHTDRLTLDESLAVVTSRAAGFAPLIAMFCHAWSGGLARDLLRAARAAVELQRREPRQALRVRQIVEHLVLTDLRAAIHASLRALEPGAPQVTMLWALHQALAGPSPVVPDMAFTTPSLQALHAKARLGVSLVRLAGEAHRLPHFWDEGSAALTALRRHVAEHADAMGEIGAQPPVREAALAVALREFDPAVLEANR